MKSISCCKKASVSLLPHPPTCDSTFETYRQWQQQMSTWNPTSTPPPPPPFYPPPACSPNHRDHGKKAFIITACELPTSRFRASLKGSCRQTAPSACTEPTWFSVQSLQIYNLTRREEMGWGNEQKGGAGKTSEAGRTISWHWAFFHYQE